MPQEPEAAREEIRDFEKLAEATQKCAQLFLDRVKANIKTTIVFSWDGTEAKISEKPDPTEEQSQVLESQPAIGTIKAPDIAHFGGINNQGIIEARFEDDVDALPGWKYKKGDRIRHNETGDEGIVANLQEEPERYLVNWYKPKREAMFLAKGHLEEETTAF